jgi:hypothetical protein
MVSETSKRTLTIEHNGQTYYGHIAKIESTMLGLEDHGVVTAYLHLKWDGSGIGVGGYCLDTPVKKPDGTHSHREGTGYGLDHIMRLTQTVGVSTWENLTGADVIVLFTTESSWGSMAKGIAGLHNGKVMILKEHAEQWEAAHSESAAVSS